MGTPPTVAIGGSAAEALVAMLAPDRTDRNKKTSSGCSAGFSLGRRHRSRNDDQLVDLLHRHSFGAVPGGTFWTVDPGYDLQLVSWRDAEGPTSADNGSSSASTTAACFTSGSSTPAPACHRQG